MCTQTGEALLHHGCVYNSIRSDHVDVPWLLCVVILLRLSLHISSKVTDHARMNLLTNMGLMVAFQMATISVLGCIAFKAPSQIQSSSHYCIVA